MIDIKGFKKQFVKYNVKIFGVFAIIFVTASATFICNFPQH